MRKFLLVVVLFLTVALPAFAGDGSQKSPWTIHEVNEFARSNKNGFWHQENGSQIHFKSVGGRDRYVEVTGDTVGFIDYGSTVVNHDQKKIRVDQTSIIRLRGGRFEARDGRRFDELLTKSASISPADIASIAVNPIVGLTKLVTKHAKANPPKTPTPQVPQAEELQGVLLVFPDGAEELAPPDSQAEETDRGLFVTFGQGHPRAGERWLMPEGTQYAYVLKAQEPLPEVYYPETSTVIVDTPATQAPITSDKFYAGDEAHIWLEKQAEKLKAAQQYVPEPAPVVVYAPPATAMAPTPIPTPVPTIVPPSTIVPPIPAPAPTIVTAPVSQSAPTFLDPNNLKVLERLSQIAPKDNWVVSNRGECYHVDLSGDNEIGFLLPKWALSGDSDEVKRIKPGKPLVTRYGLTIWVSGGTKVPW